MPVRQLCQSRAALAITLLCAWSRLGALLALSGYLLVAHGCHADEDHELFKVTHVGVAH